MRSASSAEPWAARSGSSRRTPSGSRRSSASSSAKAARRLRSRQAAVEQQLPHVLEGATSGQIGGRVLAIVEEALAAADVADGRLGDDDSFEASGRLRPDLAGGPYLGH